MLCLVLHVLPWNHCLEKGPSWVGEGVKPELCVGEDVGELLAQP